MKLIKDLPAHSRPREKLREKGPSALTDQQLVMAILGSGRKGQDVIAVSKAVAKLIRDHQSGLSLDHLMSVPGIGLAKAAQILSAFELARRYLLKESHKISGIEDVLQLVADIRDKKQEYFVCISLNGANELIEKRIVTIGLVNSSQVHPREVFADVIADRAASVILAHNHPSGDAKPSRTDARTQKQLSDAAEILGIRILDHVIVTKAAYFSFQEKGLLG